MKELEIIDVSYVVNGRKDALMETIRIHERWFPGETMKMSHSVRYTISVVLKYRRERIPGIIAGGIYDGLVAARIEIPAYGHYYKSITFPSVEEVRAAIDGWEGNPRLTALIENAVKREGAIINWDAEKREFVEA